PNVEVASEAREGRSASALGEAVLADENRGRAREGLDARAGKANSAENGIGQLDTVPCLAESLRGHTALARRQGIDETGKDHGARRRGGACSIKRAGAKLDGPESRPGIDASEGALEARRRKALAHGDAVVGDAPRDAEAPIATEETERRDIAAEHEAARR